MPRLAIFLVGFTAMASQIVLIRELLIVFYGNELSIGFILAGWLAGGSIGSVCAGLAADRVKRPGPVFAACQMALASALPLTVWAIRSAKAVLGFSVGQMMPPFPMAIASLVILAPGCAILGALFSLGCRISRGEPAARGAERIGGVYVTESLGSIAGGLIASFACVPFLGSLTTIGLLSVLNAASAFLMPARAPERGRAGRVFLAVAGAFLAALVVVSLSGGWGFLDRYLLARQWDGYELVASRSSRYGAVTIVKRDGQFSIFDNGLHLCTVPDAMAAEESVHYALLAHPSPRSLLMIGGGAGGALGEALKHPLAKVDYVELDPLVTGMIRDYLPGAAYRPFEDRRVSVAYTDGRYFVKNTNDRYDCIIVNLGDPYTAEINRYYTMEFFGEAKRVLNDGGVLSFGLTSSESYISRELADYLRSVYATLSAVFSEVKVIPGERAFFLAADASRGARLACGHETLERRVRERSVDIRFVRDYYLFSKLSRERIAYVERVIMSGNGIRVNLDFWPVSYYYATAFWISHFRGSIFAPALAALREGVVWVSLAAVYACVLLAGFAGRRDRKRANAAGAYLAVTAAGFTGMAFQVIIVLAFQMLYGYVFYKLGVILTSFMAGLAAGGWWMVRRFPVMKGSRRAFIAVQAALALYPAFLPWIFSRLAASRGAAETWVGANVVFILLPAIAGCIGGAQFPLASRIALRADHETAMVGGRIYGLDLLGACAGAIAAGAVLIPVIGVAATCLSVAFLNALVLLVVVARTREKEALP